MTTTKKTTKAKPTVTRKKKTTPFVVDNLPARPLAFEILDLVSRSRSKAKKIEVLKKYDEQNTYNGTLSTKISQDVRTMHETGNFSLGVSDQQGHTTIRRESKNFYNFIRGGNDAMSNIRRETMFINILTGLHPLEAEIVVLAKDKKISDKYNITREIVEEAYPNIVWGDKS